MKICYETFVIQLVEAASSICIHILMRKFNEKAEGYPQCFIKLGERNIIPIELANKLASAARMRNLLVYRYWIINDNKIYNSVKKGLNDFKVFIHYIRKYLMEDES